MPGKLPKQSESAKPKLLELGVSGVQIGLEPHGQHQPSRAALTEQRGALRRLIMSS